MDLLSAFVLAAWVSRSFWAAGLVALYCDTGIWLRHPKLMLVPLIGAGLVVCALVEQIGEALDYHERHEWILDYILEWAGVPEDDAEFVS
ncbi:hypothetical protein NG831_06485 [Xanthomonas sacchari]|uniref:hypothetical protein n=1 Tax=Xanthomonas sacchari TaxID=56458 RepID=UPI002253AF74|nr:hypothetical protein [Xanthomonas sacchari]MCW0413492.1 hypothetical protein [Xanthomonas sacchari]UYK67807.1 hypothetical protein NG831_06485 [Xanthomonas sacchari]